MKLKRFLQRKKFWFDDWCQGSPLWNAYMEIKQMNNDTHLPPEISINKGIAQWQFIQTGQKDYTLKLSLKDKNLISEESLFKQYLNAILGPEAQIKIMFTNDIPVLNSGKRLLIINEYNK